MIIDLDKLSSAMEEVASTIILPRFQKLSRDDIEEKSKGDFVTIADREAEQALTPILKSLAPGSVIVGEEATAADPSLLNMARDDGSIWFVDPIDGTAQFIEGCADFATMIAYVEKGEVRQSVIYFPVSGNLFLAELGSGATLREKCGIHTDLTVSAKAPPLGAARTTLFTHHFPSGWEGRLERLRSGVSEVKNKRPSACQYTDLVRGEIDLVVYHRMYPWDHAPGSLLLREAGGTSRNLETGTDYQPAILQGPHLLATSPSLWEAAQQLVV